MQLNCFFLAANRVCIKDIHSILVVDSSSGRLRLNTSVEALITYLRNLWLFLSVFNLTGTTTTLTDDETVSSSTALFTKKPRRTFRVPRVLLRPKDQTEHYVLLPLDDTRRPRGNVEKGDRTQSQLHSTHRRLKPLNSLCWKLLFQYEWR